MIKNAKFIISVATSNNIRNFNAPEIAFAGRSNVGKSSLINFLCNQKNLARTSSEPGRTRLINYFEINNGQFYFVDLPGYGYAKVNNAEKERWGVLIEDYLKTSENLKNVFVLVDIRHEPTDDDRMLVNFLYSFGIPFSIIATKADKLSRLQRSAAKRMIAQSLKVGEGNIIVTSSDAKIGKQEIEEKIDAILNA